MSIGDWDEQRLEAFVRSRLNLPENLRAKLAGSLLKLLVPGELRVAYGINTVVFSAADASAELTVPHGLGAVPVVVLFTARANPVARIVLQESTASDATNVYVTGYQTQGTVITQNQTFYWLAIG